MRSRSSAAAIVALAGTLGLVHQAAAQPTITLFGQTYDVQRFSYSDEVTLNEIQFFESEGMHYLGNNKLVMTFDDIPDIFPGYPDNWYIEVDLLTSGNTITGLAYSRTIATVDAAADGYDPDPGGVTVNTSNSGLGSGGNLVVSGNNGNLYGISLQSGNLGQLLEFPAGSGCQFNAPGACNLDISANNVNAEDAVFIPSSSVRPDPAFFVINQDLGGLDSTGIEIWSTTGTLVSSFLVGDAVDVGLTGGVAKGLTYLPDSPSLPPALRRPGGVVLVSFDRNFPAIQAFDVLGNFIGTEYLTTNALPNGPNRLDMTGCTRPPRPHLESLAFDPQTGRIFLSNQGVFLTCNFMWILTPQSTGCEAEYNGDGTLNLDDLSDFITDFYTVPPIPGGLQPSAPTYSDVAIGWGVPCDQAGDAPAPYAVNAYRADGYRVGFSADGSNACPGDPGQTFPSLDNLSEYITEYYSRFGQGNC
jgi:hypothetical protein